jgi:uncharacterized protein (DUF1330 family)
MTAYLIGEVTVHDPEAYEAYKVLAPETLAAYGGVYVLRGPKIVPLEGDWDPQRLVIVSFPDTGAAQRWYNSPEYRAARKIREPAAVARMVIAEVP